MAVMVAKQRHFLFLQGPHGPFFGKLAKALVVTGAKVSRIGFNRGDQYFWPRGFGLELLSGVAMPDGKNYTSRTLYRFLV